MIANEYSKEQAVAPDKEQLRTETMRRLSRKARMEMKKTVEKNKKQKNNITHTMPKKRQKKSKEPQQQHPNKMKK